MQHGCSRIQVDLWTFPGGPLLSHRISALVPPAHEAPAATCRCPAPPIPHSWALVVSFLTICSLSNPHLPRVYVLVVYLFAGSLSHRFEKSDILFYWPHNPGGLGYVAHRRTPQISDEGLYPRLLALRTNHTRDLPLFQLDYLYLKMVDIFKLSLRFYQKKKNEVQSLHSYRHA